MRSSTSCISSQTSTNQVTCLLLPGLVLHAPTSESVKCQAVVDALSNQLSPHVSLNHIRGELLARPDLMAVKHLLDVFSVLFHLPRAGIGGEESGSELEDSNVISREGQF